MVSSRVSVRPALLLGLFLCPALLLAQGFKLQQTYLEPVLARANRPGQISVVLQNTNPIAAANLTVALSLPAGAAGIGPSTGLVWSVPAWNASEVKTLSWDVQSSVSTNGTARVLVKQGTATLLNAPFPVWWQAALTITNHSYVPPPEPAGTGRYLVGAMICPFWRDTGYNSIAGYPDRKPVLGYFDEGDFETTDWEVKWALDNGVAFFNVCWYRDPANVGASPVVPQHHRWLEGGFLNGRYGSQAKFAIMSVGDIASSKEDLVANVFPYWMENYFKRTNYLVIDNKPVLYFFTTPLPTNIMATALTEMRTAAQAAGFAGLYAIGCYNGFTSAGPYTNNIWMVHAGMDYSFAYHIPTFMGTLSSTTPGTLEIINDHQQIWDAQQAGALRNLVTVSSGWNSEPWGNMHSTSKWRLNPASYGTILQNVKNELDSRLGTGLDTKIVLLDNWDEWGEGHFVGVTREYAWGYLDAVRQVFSTNTTPQLDLGPEDVGRGTPYYDGQHRGSMVQASVNSLPVAVGGTNQFQVALSTPPAGIVVVSNSLSRGATNALILSGAQLLFTPANWNVPQNVTVAATAPSTRRVYLFSSAGGTSGFAEDWVLLNFFSNPTNPPLSGAWSADANGVWSAPANWVGSFVPTGLTATAFFTNPISTLRTVTADTHPGGITRLVFGSPGAHSWSLAGAPIQLAPASLIEVHSNTAFITNNLNGSAWLTKSGAGTLFLLGTNGYSAGTTLLAGTLRAGSTGAFGSQAVSVSSGSTLDVFGKRVSSDVIVAGAGHDGNGSLVNTSGSQGGIQALTLTADAAVRDIFSGLNVFGSISGGGHTLTVRGNAANGYFGLGNGQSFLGHINVLSGALYANGYLPNLNGCLGQPDRTITVAPDATLGLIKSGTTVFDKRLNLNGGRLLQSQTGSPTFVGPIFLAADSQIEASDLLTLSGPISGTGGFRKTGAGTLTLAASNSFAGPTHLVTGTLQIAHSHALSASTLNYTNGSFSFGGETLAVLGSVSGTRNLFLTNSSGASATLVVGANNASTVYSGSLGGGGSVHKIGLGTLTLSGLNTFNGPLTVSAGTLALGAASSLPFASPIAISNAATLSFSALIGGFSSSATQVFTGDGALTGNVTFNGTLRPGAPVGRLTVNGTAALRGTTALELAKSGSLWINDQIVVSGSVSYGGSLQVIKLGPHPLAEGSYQLFSASGYTGAFTNLILPSLDAGLLWTNRLLIDGTLEVVRQVPSDPPLLSVTLLGNQFVVSWPATHIGWRLESQSSAVTGGLGSNWMTLPNSTLSNVFTLALPTSNTAAFYRLVYP